MFLTKYQRPEAGLSRLLDMQDEFERFFTAPLGNLARAWTPPLDVSEDKDNYVVHTELPGMKREDIEVSLNDGALIITGERKGETEKDGVAVHRRERFYGRFERAIALPKAVNADKVKAQFKDGVLTITLPKSEEAKPRHIDVAMN